MPKSAPALDNSVNFRWLNLVASCLYLGGCSPGYLRKLIHEGELKAVRCGKGFLLDRQDLDNFLLRRKKFFNPYRRGSKPWVAERHAAKRERCA